MTTWAISDAISRYAAAIEDAIRTGDGCNGCRHTECSCDCQVCVAAAAIERSPCLCSSCSWMRFRTKT